MTSQINHQRTLFSIFGASIMLNTLLWFLAIFVFPKDLTTAVLHYSVDVGIDFIGAGQQIIVLPLAGLFVLLGNGLLGAVLRKSDLRTSWIFWSIIPIVQIILVGAFYLIWQANR